MDKKMTDREAVEYAIATAKLEGFQFTEKELAILEKIASGALTTEEFRSQLMTELARLKQSRPELFRGDK